VEDYLSQYPVNQRVVAGEPIVSDHDRRRRIQVGYVERKQSDLPGRKSEWDVDGFVKNGFDRTIKKTKTHRGYVIDIEFVSLNETMVGKTMSRAAIKKSFENTRKNGFGG
jgi:hypothetical protein